MSSKKAIVGCVGTALMLTLLVSMFSLMPAFAQTVEVLRPNADVITEWAVKPPAVPHYTTVDETPSDELKEYVYTFEDGKVECFDLTQPTPLPTWEISNIKVIVRARLNITAGSKADDQLLLMLRIGGTQYFAAKPHNLTIDFVYYSNVWEKNPATGTKWEWTDIPGLQAGFKSIQVINASYILVTQLYVEVSPVLPAPPPPGYGPRNDYILYYYADETALYAALKAGVIDLTWWPLTYTQYLDAIKDPAIQLAESEELGIRAYSLNNNETIAFYPGVKNPLTNLNFRRALFRLTNKYYYWEFILKRMAVVMEVPIPSPSSGWWNKSVIEWAGVSAPIPGYPEPFPGALTYDKDDAKRLLDEAGFVDIPEDEDTWRNYPRGWPGAGDPPRNIDPIVIFARRDDTLRLQAGEHLAAELESVGIRVDLRREDFSTCYTFVMSARNYHIYTAGWSVGRFPTYLYTLFHTDYWFPGGSNYHLSKTPHYPEIDETGVKIYFPPNMLEAENAVKLQQYLIIQKYSVFIPLWNARSYYGYRNILGAVNMQSVGPENDYTLINAYRADDPTAPIRAGHKSPPLELNPIYSRWVWDVSTMGPFWIGRISVQPYDIMRDQPWAAQDWLYEEWVDPDDGLKKSKYTFWLRKDLKWVAPVTGAVAETFDAADFPFNCWYFFSEPLGWIYSTYMATRYVRLDPADPYKVTIMFDDVSFWSQYWSWGRNIYPPAWKREPLSSLLTKTYVVGTNMTAPGFPHKTILRTDPKRIVGINATAPGFTATTDYWGKWDSVTVKFPNGTERDLVYGTEYIPCPGYRKIKILVSLPAGTWVINKYYVYDLPVRAKFQPVEIIEVKAGTETLIPYQDYEICSGMVRIYKSLAAGTVVTIKYWARNDPAGYTPGGLPWQEVFYGAGTHYMVDHVPGVGGWTVYKANRNFFLETPVPPKLPGEPILPGEVDWVYVCECHGEPFWMCTNPARPRKSYFIVDIYDVVYATAAYDGVGNGDPITPLGKRWRVGADLNTPECLIDIYDVVFITAKYGRIFGKQP